MGEVAWDGGEEEVVRGATQSSSNRAELSQREPSSKGRETKLREKQSGTD